MSLTRADPLSRLSEAVRQLRTAHPVLTFSGSVVLATPTHYKVSGLSKRVQLGDCVEAHYSGRAFLAQVIRVDPETATITFFDSDVSIPLGTMVTKCGALRITPSAKWKGRVIDALARPIDGKGPIDASGLSKITDAVPPAALQRERLGEPITTGIRVIDLFTPLCAGQRIGIFAGSGVGKSTLLGMLARSSGFDATVVVLVGERGREVREFMEDILGDALKSAVVVVATGDECPMMRRQSPRTGMAIAEALREEGERVLLIVDSVTRYAHALREVALAGGEPPVARGYTPSVLHDLPRLLERAGPGLPGSGTITGVISVLVDGDDHNDPISDAVRGILDGHIVLDRTVAARGQYPAVNIVASVSRLADRAWSADQRDLVLRLRHYVSTYEDSRDLRMMGAYKAGSNAELDRAVRLVPPLYAFLAQRTNLPAEDVFQSLARILEPIG